MSAESQLDLLAHLGARTRGNRCDVVDCLPCRREAEREHATRTDPKTDHEVTVDDQPGISTDVRHDQVRAAFESTTRWFVPTWRWTVKVTWTNWTFGAWWGKVGRRYMIGIDVGPLEVTRVRTFERSTRAKHRPRR